jgi:translation initiation factor IF-3
MNFTTNMATTADLYRVGKRIRALEVRVIDDTGAQIGVMKTFEALRLADDKGVDLVEINSKSVPPICKLLDFGKFKFEQAKKARQENRNAFVVLTKEVKFRPKTDDHDFDFKVKHIREFIEEGHKVKLIVAFRGREMAHPEIGRAMLDRVLRVCADIARIDQIPLMDGKNIVAVISKKK